MELRQCGRDDISQLMQLALQSYREHYMYLWTEERYALWYMEKSFARPSLERQLEQPCSAFYFVCSQGTPIGFVKTNTGKSVDGSPTEKAWELERIYLLKAATNKGIGGHAMKEVVQLARNGKAETLWLKSMDSSPSVRFYEKMGFRTIATETLPFEGFKDEYRNMKVMRLDLEP
ncbi:GNAT family N-acetyltransferase [Paraflavisolibacter sp. H34]|uniref:GNAT family N-acetyltransferase n=1 Tax=Huijunlia imazamoxiresistens TaxID=3127457 RepID=UPI003019E950